MANPRGSKIDIVTHPSLGDNSVAVSYNDAKVTSDNKSDTSKSSAAEKKPPKKVKLTKVEKQQREQAVDAAFEEVIKKVFLLLPEAEKKGIRAGIKCRSAAKLEEKVSLSSPDKLREKYGYKLVCLFYNILIDIRPLFLKRMDFLDEIEQHPENKKSFVLLYIAKNLASLIWQSITGKNPYTLFKEIISLDKHSEDIRYNMPSVLDQRSMELAQVALEFFNALLGIKNIPGKNSLRMYIDEMNQRIHRLRATEHLSKTLEQFKDLKDLNQIARIYFQEKKDISKLILDAMSLFIMGSMTHPPDIVVHLNNLVCKGLNDLKKELKKKKSATKEEIDYYNFLQLFYLQISIVLRYPMVQGLAQQFSPNKKTINKIHALSAKLKDSKSESPLPIKKVKLKKVELEKVEPKKPLAFEPCDYLDKVCEEIKIIAKSIKTEENKEIKDKLEQVISGIQADKREYIHNRDSFTPIAGLNQLQNKVTTRLNGVISLGKGHGLLHPLHRVYNALYALVQHVISEFSLAKYLTKTSKIQAANERYTISCGLFSAKNSLNQRLKNEIAATNRADVEYRINSLA